MPQTIELDKKPGGRQAAVTDKALKMVDEGMTAYAAAKKVGIALSTIYRALRRREEAEGRRRRQAARRRSRP
jgi:transposase